MARFVSLSASIFVGLALPALAQPQVLLSGRPDVHINVKKSSVGPEYVVIRMQDEKYPKDLLADQIERLGQYKNTDIRGLEIVYTAAGGMIGNMLTASFAMNGLIDRQAGTLELNAFARAFAGGPEAHRVEMLAITFENERPKEGVTVAKSSGAANVISQYDANLNAVDYRVTLKTQNPDQIRIPETVQDQTKQAQQASKVQSGGHLVPWVAAAAVAAGVLVYFALRPGRKAKQKAGQA
ncbi:MAG: hypothetical protein ACR2HJ_11835 [Fimbriimonadales bacterium]